MKRRKEATGDGFEAWGGYMNAKISKLEEQYVEDAKNLNPSSKLSNIFEGVAIFVNGYSEPPAEILRRLMMQHGGVFHDYQVKGTTHVIASNLPNAKLQQQAFARVIRPDWIVDSISAGKLLPTSSYLLSARPALQPALPFQVTSTDSKKAAAKTAVDSNFISEFYNNSRLHHLSTMGAQFKQYFSQLKENHDGTFPGLNRLRALASKESSPSQNSSIEKTIMHIDMDSFFVSVALRDRPDLIGKPVAVCHAKGNNVPHREGANADVELAIYQSRTGGNVDSKFCAKGGGALGSRESMSEVASCSYEARASGVKNGMYLGRALSLCPGLITVPYNFEAYTEVSYSLYDTVAEYTLSVEAVSCDEMFIDCTSVFKATGATPMQFAQCLRNDVTTRTRCPCSTGLGPNKLVARLASRKAKPNGQYHVMSSDVEMFMSDVMIKDLPGVGWSTSRKLKELDVESCLDLQNIALSVLKSQLGNKNGETLYRYCRGIDSRPVLTEHQRKSVSAEVNYGIRFKSSSDAEDFLRRLSNEVCERLTSLNLKGRSITLKLLTRSADAPVEAAKFLGHGVCDAVSKSILLGSATSDASIIAENVLKLNNQLGVPPEDMRGIGIQVTKLDSKTRSGSLQSFLARKNDIKCKVEKSVSPKKISSGSSELGGERKGLKPEKVQSNGISRLLQQGTFKKSQSSFNVGKNEPSPQLPPISELDLGFLEALPVDMQKEILAQYGLKSLSDIPKSNGERKISIKSEEPELSDIDSKDSTDLNQPHNLFEGMSSLELRSAISSWVESEAIPQPFDVNMLGSHVSRLVLSRRIEIVDEALRCFWRNVKKHRGEVAEWSASYRSVVEQVQEAMLKKYGHPLRVLKL